MQSRRPKPTRVSEKGNHSGSSSTPRFKKEEGGPKRPRIHKNGDKSSYERNSFRERNDQSPFSYLRKTNEKINEEKKRTFGGEKPALKNSFGQKSKEVMDRFNKRSDRRDENSTDSRNYGERQGAKRGDRQDDGERRSHRERPSRFGSSSSFEDRGGGRPFERRSEDRNDRPFSEKKRQEGVGRPQGRKPWERDERSSGDGANRFDPDRKAKPFFDKPGASSAPRRKTSEASFGKKKAHSTPSDESLGIRLNRFIANSGVCARREADKLIEAGEIYVNGKVMTDFSYRVQPTDTVKYGSRILKREKFVYILINKPKDFLTTTDDPEERKTVMDLVRDASGARLYPVGRLDRNTTGLLVITNDGDLADKLMHPSFMTKKIYQVDLDRPFSESDLEKLRTGITLEDGFIKADDIEIVSPDRKSVGLEIHSGRNRLVRRMFEHLEYTVVRLDRVMYAGLTKKELPRGTWRYLTDMEVGNLKRL